MEREKWQQVGRYYISSLGQVKTKTGRILKGYKSKSGHIIVHLADRHVAVSTLVADAFIKGTGKVYHKDGDLENNRVENLERR